MTRRNWMMLALAPVSDGWSQERKPPTVEEIAASLQQQPNYRPIIAELREAEEAAGKEGKVGKGEKAASLALASVFDRATDKKAKQDAASALLSRGSQELKYWEYLAGFARKAVENKAPWPLAYDENGRVRQGKFSADFLEWCKTHQSNPAQLADEITNEHARDVFIITALPDSRSKTLQVADNIRSGLEDSTADLVLLMFFHGRDFDIFAVNRDPRIKPILMKGLSSPNHLVVLFSAHGLARLLEHSAVPYIKSACARVPAEFASLIAYSLFWYGEADLDAVAKKYIPDVAEFEKYWTEVDIAKTTALRKRARQ